MGRVEWDPNWPAEAELAVHEFMDNDLGPEIVNDAVLYCPKDTGALAESIDKKIRRAGPHELPRQPWAFRGGKQPARLFRPRVLPAPAFPEEGALHRAPPVAF